MIAILALVWRIAAYYLPLRLLLRGFRESHDRYLILQDSRNDPNSTFYQIRKINKK